MTAVKKQKALGRGLDALLGDAPKARAAAPAGPRSKTALPIEFLAPNPDQPRRLFDGDAIDELAASIKARGLLQPILVRPAGADNYEIVAGERRWRAAQKAKLHEVPVIIRKLTDAAAAEITLIENVQRVDLNPVEEARGYQRLTETYGRSHDQIAKAVGKSRSHVANTMRLLALPALALDALARGEISAGHARAILTAPQPEIVLLAVLKEGLSVRDTERLVREANAMERKKAGDGGNNTAVSGAKKSGSGKKDADTRALEADLAAAVGLEVEIDHTSRGSGAVSIRYLNLDQLDDICRRLMGAGV